MRAIQRRVVPRLIASATVAGLLTVPAWRMGPLVSTAALFVVLSVVVFAALTIAPDAIALARGHHWRWWWRAPDDCGGPFWPGTHIPRGPRRPHP